MTDVIQDAAVGSLDGQAIGMEKDRQQGISEAVARSLRRIAPAIAVALISLVTLLGSIGVRGYKAFWQTAIAIDVPLDKTIIDPDGGRDPSVLVCS